MNCLSHSHKETRYSSIEWQESQAFPGVRFALRRVSLAQRLELTGRIRELTVRHEFLRAGTTPDQLEATFSDLLVKRLYLEWGLAQVEGLTIDGTPATIESLIEKGPEELVEEILLALRSLTGLSEDERKNS